MRKNERTWWGGPMIARFLLALFATLLISVHARAAQCGGDFNTFLSAMGREAQAAGVSRDVIDQAFAGVTIDQAVLSFDRRQRGMFPQELRGIRRHPRHPGPHQARQRADAKARRSCCRASSSNSACRKNC